MQMRENSSVFVDKNLTYVAIKFTKKKSNDKTHLLLLFQIERRFDYDENTLTSVRG